MASEDKKPELMGIPPFLGIAVLTIGMFFLVWGPKYIGTQEWVWWTGILFSGVGIVLWIFSGMTKAQAIEWSKSGLVALVFALTFRWGIAEPYRIPSDSMVPTLEGDERIGRGDRVFVNKWIYGIRYPFMNKRIWQGHAPERWDIVVFKSVEKDPQHSTLVKRIVGMPGERIQIRNGKVFANGEPLQIPESMPQDQFYSSEPAYMTYGVKDIDEFSIVPEGHYLVMGDNSRNSRDGRYFGWLPNENIVGRVASIWWPPQRWRDFTGFSQTIWWKALVTLTLLWIFFRMFIGRSWPYHAQTEKGARHLVICFLKIGLRVPMTRLWLAQWGRPARGEIVLYHPPRSERFASDLVLCGRIAALPGEKIAITNGKLFVNGEEPIEAPTVAALQLLATDEDALFGRARSKEHTQVPEGHYYILSDEDETGLYDSRSFGWVPQKSVLGSSVATWWPPSAWSTQD